MTTIGDVEALRAQLWAAGFRPIAILSADHPDPAKAGKAPLADRWTETARTDPPEGVRFPPVPFALNTGILADGLRAIDFDIDNREIARQCRDAASRLLGEAPIRFRRNSPRFLALYRAAEGSPPKITLTGADHDPKTGNARKIEVLGRGQQFVAFGRHASGADLEWFPEAPGDETLNSLPVVSEDAIHAFLSEVAAIIGAPQPQRANGHDHTPGEAQTDPLRLASYLNSIPNTGPADWETWNRVGMALWRGCGGSDMGLVAWHAWSQRNAAYDPKETEERWHHYRRSPPTELGAGTIIRLAKIADQAEPPEVETDPGYWNSIEGGAGTRQEPTEEVAADGNNVVKLKPKRNKKAQWGWKQEWHVSENGNPLPTLFNAMVALRNSEGLTDIVRYDEMARSVILSTQIPNTPQDKTIPRHIKDGDIIAIQEELQLIGLRRVAKATVQDAIQLRAEQDKFHPVRDYLNSLTWDGTRRIFGWLGRYLGVEGSPYSDKIGELFLIALVARQFKPGCKADYMLILEGPQGALKSSACRVLAGEWFSDNLPDLSRGDAVRLSMHLRGKWLIEIAEMSSFNAAESHKLKEFLTQTEEVYTPKYGHNEVHEPRQCLFIGTTNEAAYLRDATGGRRFWPAKTGEILLPDLAADRDQLFAEAVSLYREGAPWWPDREFEAEHIAPQQDERFERHPWQEPIETWIAENGIQRCTVTSVLTGPLAVPLAQISRRMQSDVAAIFVGLKWFRSRSRGRDWFVRPKTEDAG